MKIHIDLPWGGALEAEYQPMKKDKFYMMWAMICVMTVFRGLFGIFM